MSSCVYRCFDADGSLIYVGCTANLERRLTNHTQRPWWRDIVTISVTHFDRHVDAGTAERAAIASENPRENVGPMSTADAQLRRQESRRQYLQWREERVS